MTITGLLSSLAKLAAKERDGRAVLAASNAVTISTWHGAKGLEWPVVAVADLDRRFQMPRGNLLMDPTVGMGLKLRDENLELKAGEDYERVKGALNLLELAEQQRLLYVAMTRARRRLLLPPPTHRRPRGSPTTPRGVPGASPG